MKRLVGVWLRWRSWGARLEVLRAGTCASQRAAATEVGDNTIARALADKLESPTINLDNMSYAEHYGNTVSSFGQELSLVNVRLNDQKAVQNMLQRQRDSVQGVSIDEEVANRIIFQRAFQASARLISTMNTLMGDVINMQR